MRPANKTFSVLKGALLAWAALTVGCATQTEALDVGQVVVAPQAKLQPLPKIVMETEPKPVGYFQCSFLTYFGSDCESPTPSTPPTPPAAALP